MYPSTSTQQPAAICALKSPADAIHILEAVRLGLVPRVTRRLTGHERSMIRPGTVWVWEEEETNMRRWTDGRRWGASRVGGGGFLVYTESSDNLSPPPSRGTGSDYMDRTPAGHSGHGYSPYGRSALKPESLIKQTYSTTMTHPVTGKAKKFHVVAYSSKHNPQGDANNPLPLPQQLPLLATLKITPGIWPEWEHRRDPDFSSRRATSYPPVPSGSQSTPVTATASPDGADQFHRGRSPPREAYTAQASPRYAQPYSAPAQQMQQPYSARPISYPPPDRFHPYQARPFPPPSSAASSSSTIPLGMPQTTQDGAAFYEDRRYPRLSPPQPYAHPYDPYGRGGYPRREPYFDELPPPGAYFDPAARPDDKAYSHERHHSAPITHLVPPPVENTGAKSPKMSIDSSLLNPQSAAMQQQMPMSTSPVNGQVPQQPVGLTLPPLRLAIDERGMPINMSGANSPSGYGKTSPRVSSDGGQSSSGKDGSNRGEDARQLGELGKTVSL